MQAVNDKTGEVFELIDGQWQKVSNGQPEPVKAPKADPLAGRVSSGATEAILASAGDSLTTMGRNARDLWAGLRGDDKAQLAIADERMEADKIRAQLHGEAPIAAGIGGALPSLATLPIGMGIGGAGMLAGAGGRLATNIASGAAVGGLASSSGDVAGGALEGGALAGVTSLAGNMVSRVREGRRAMSEARAAQAAGQAIGGQLDEGERAVIEGARRAGMHVTPGQALGDPTMRRIEAGATSNPVLSPYWDQLRRENAQQLGTLTARAMGVEADNVGAVVRAQAEHGIGNDFRLVGERLGRVETAGLHKALIQKAEEEATAGLPTNDAWRVLKRFEKGAAGRGRAVEGVPDEMSGAHLMDMRSQVADDMRQAFAQSDHTRGRILGEVLDLVDDQVGKIARARGDEGIVDLYATARDRWSVLRALEHGGATPDGQVSIGRMAQIMGQSDKTRYVGRAGDLGETMQMGGTGRLGENALGDLYDALRFSSSRIGKDIVGDSGTATRLSMSGMFEGGLAGTATRALGYAARKAAAGPLARYYMGASPEAAQAWASAAERSALRGWAAGQQQGAQAGRAVQGIIPGATQQGGE